MYKIVNVQYYVLFRIQIMLYFATLFKIFNSFQLKSLVSKNAKNEQHK
jgi:hypothetical protein